MLGKPGESWGRESSTLRRRRARIPGMEERSARQGPTLIQQRRLVALVCGLPLVCGLFGVACAPPAPRKNPWSAAEEGSCQEGKPFHLQHGSLDVEGKFVRGPTWLRLELELSGPAEEPQPKLRFEDVAAYWDNEALSVQGLRSSGEIPTKRKDGRWRAALRLKVKVHSWPKDILYLKLGSATWRLSMGI